MIGLPDLKPMDCIPRGSVPARFQGQGEAGILALTIEASNDINEKREY